MILKKENREELIIENEIYIVNKNIKLHIRKENGKIINYHFTSKKVPFNCSDQIYYYYFDEKIFAEFKTKHFTEIDFKKFIIPFDKFKDDEVDYKRVLYPYYGGHMIFCLKDLYPIPTVMIFNYISGISDRDFYINEVFNYLKKHPYIVFVDKESIPYYNQESDYTMGLTMRVLFPNNLFNKMWNCVKKTKYPSTNLKNMVCNKFAFEQYKIDPLRIKKFLKLDK